MKTIYKVILVVGGTILFSELVHIIPTPVFIQKHIDKMNAKNKANIEAMEKFAPKSSKNLPVELDVFKKSDGFKFNETLNFINRSSTAKFFYKDKYEITVYRIDSSFNNSLKKVLKETNVNSDPNINVHFANDDIGYIQFYYNNDNILPKTDSIYLNLYGTNTRTILGNDTITCYYSNLINAFVQYNVNGPQDIYAKSTSDNCPTEIMFLKRKGSLYLLFMTNKDHGYSLNPNLLYNLAVSSDQ